jgi:HlyD family secretion protein
MSISRNRKAILVVAIVVGLVTIIVLSKAIRKNDGEPVQTAKVERKVRIDSKVQASGQIMPVQIHNITAEVSGRVEQIFVSEGDTVKKGQPLVKVDPTQFSLQTEGARATVSTAQADSANQRVAVQAAQTAVNQAQSNLAAAKSDLERDKANFRYQQAEYNRNLQLVEQGIISPSLFGQVKSQFEQAEAVVKSTESRVEQLREQEKTAELGVKQAQAALESTQGRLKTAESVLGQQADFLKKTTEYAPIDGVVSSLPVKVGEFALANFSTTPLLTIADMSEINAEIEVDETDIDNVKIGQSAKIKVDALGEMEIEGKVFEKAASAVVKGTGQVVQQGTNTQQAKDFVVKIRLNPSADVAKKLKPGMSSTAVITTATVDNALAVPLQAIVPRDAPASGPDVAQADQSGASGVTHKKEIDGVFVLQKDNHAHFVPVETGIKGDQEIEIKSGVNEGDEIVTGPYKTLRSLKDNDPVKREPKSGVAADSKTGQPK